MATPGKAGSLSVSAIAKLAGTGVFCITLLVYIKTMCIGLPFGDSSELATSSYTLGIAHPTTYPLFTIVGFLWSHLPIPGRPVYRLDLLAAVCTSMASWIFFKISYLVTTKLRPDAEGSEPANWQVAIAAAAGLAFSFASVVWDQGSSGYEVYSFQLILFNSVLFFALRAVFRPETTPSSFLIAAFCLGLCLTNHLTTLFSVPSLVVLYFICQKFSPQSWKHFGLMLLLVLLPLPLYFYGPLRSSASFPFSGLGIPVLNEGLVGMGWGNFRAAVTGQAFKGFMFEPGALSVQANRFSDVLPSQFGFGLGLIPAAAGLAFLWRKKRQFFWFLTVMVGLTLLWILNYGIHDIDAYFLMPLTGLMILMVIGVVALRPRAMWLPTAFYFLPLLSLIHNYKTENNSGTPVDDIYIAGVAKDLEPNALLYTDQWDNFVAGFFYLQNVEGFRKDVNIAIPSNYTTFPVYTQEAAIMYPAVFKVDDPGAVKIREDIASKVGPQQLSTDALAYVHTCILQNLSVRPVYFDMQTAKGMHIDRLTDLQLIPDGLAYRVLPTGQKPDLAPPKVDITAVFDADFDAGDDQKKQVLEIIGNCVYDDAKYWKSNTDEFSNLSKIFALWLPIAKEVGVASPAIK